MMRDQDFFAVFSIGVAVIGSAILGACFMFQPNADDRIVDAEKMIEPEPVDAEPLEAALDSAHNSARIKCESTFYQSPTGADAGGVSYVSPATTIHWRPETAIDSEGATPEQILAAVADRLEFVQSTPQAADRNARALWEVLKALRHFQGPTQ